MPAGDGLSKSRIYQRKAICVECHTQILSYIFIVIFFYLKHVITTEMMRLVLIDFIRILGGVMQEKERKMFYNQLNMAEPYFYYQSI